jgi:hypothetical protein
MTRFCECRAKLHTTQPKYLLFFLVATSTTPTPGAMRPMSRKPPVIHTPPPRKRRTTSRQSTTQPHRAIIPKNNSRPIAIARITVTVTHHTCRESSKAVPTPADSGERSGSSRTDVGMIVGILMGILVFLVVLALLAFFLRRRKTTGKKRYV